MKTIDKYVFLGYVCDCGFDLEFLGYLGYLDKLEVVSGRIVSKEIRGGP